MTSGFIPVHGHYQKLLSYRKAEVVYDITFHFCRRFLSKGDRTVDQMIQAARSGKQNIAEGSQASGTSKETEIKLTNVARASLEELLIDYHDFLRVRGYPIWAKDSKEAIYARKIGANSDATYENYRALYATRTEEIVPTLPSVRSARRLISSTGNYADWKRTSSGKAVFANE